MKVNPPYAVKVNALLKIKKDEILKLIESKKFLVLEDFEYQNKDTPIKVQCDKSHVFISSYHKLKYYGCNTCAGHEKKTKESIEREFNIKILNEYINAHTDIDCQCNTCSHVFTTKYYKISLAKTVCPECRKQKISSKRISFSTILENIISEGFTYIEGEYRNNRSLLTVKCPKGHLSKIMWITWRQQGSYCSTCRYDKVSKANLQFDQKYMTQFLKSNGLELLNYHRGEITVKCENGHTTKRKWHYTHKYKRFCSECRMNKPEREIIDFLKNDLGITNIKHRTRSILGGKELDIFIPEANLAIEYNGLFWHCYDVIKNPYYHLEKYQLCLSKGIDLITIWQSEWEHKTETVKNIIANRIVKKTYAFPDIEITQIISKDTILKFHQMYHIQPLTVQTEAVGIKHKDKDIFYAILFFKICNKNLKIYSYTSTSNACEFLSLLLDAIQKKYQINSMNFLVDRRIFDEKILLNLDFQPKYEVLGFKWTDLEKIYCNTGEAKKAKRMHRIYDCGQIMYVKTINQE